MFHRLHRSDSDLHRSEVQLWFDPKPMLNDQKGVDPKCTSTLTTRCLLWHNPMSALTQPGVRFDATRCPLWRNPVSALTQPCVRFDTTLCPLWRNSVSALTQPGVRFDTTRCPLCDDLMLKSLNSALTSLIESIRLNQLLYVLCLRAEWMKVRRWFQIGIQSN